MFSNLKKKLFLVISNVRENGMETIHFIILEHGDVTYECSETKSNNLLQKDSTYKNSFIGLNW